VTTAMADPTPDPRAPAVLDSDRDALHILPLGMIPLETPALRHAKMIKNVRLRSVVELFHDAQAGSGQVDVEDLPGLFGWPESPPHPDLVILRKLALLPSYDVYSLRILLRQHGIPVNNVEYLKLSPQKNKELTEYMRAFTHPLILQVYGDAQMEIKGVEDLIALFRDPDVKKAREKLRLMAEKLEIRLDEVPKFLEDYGDIFLSLSYYRQCLDAIEPAITQFLESMEELRRNWQLRQDQNLMKTCDAIQRTINGLMAAITGRFENFDRSTKDMWNHLSAKRFRKVEALIKNYHTTIGGVLCGLTVKMTTWKALFPAKDVGGPVKRAEFIMADMKQGIENIMKIEDSAPMLAELEKEGGDPPADPAPAGPGEEKAADPPAGP
jgi:hypothetical protein